MDEFSNSHHQAMANHQHDHYQESLTQPKSSTPPIQQQQQQDKKPRPQPEQSLRCPRCDSTNTKFCYYNNYSLSQPRYFCKGCRRYWTKGGSLRNVPIGGGCRKNKRSSPSIIPNSSNCSKKPNLIQDGHQIINNHPTTSLFIPTMPIPHPLTYDPSDLTLAFSNFHNHDPFNPNPNHSQNQGGIGVQSFYYGLSGGNDEMRDMLSFEGVGGCSDSTRVAAEKVVVENHPIAGSNVNSTSTSHGSLGMESGGRDYWNAVGTNSSWHGLINSSLL